MKTNNFLKDKNKLLMIIPIVLGGLFLYVFLFTTHHQRKLRKMKKKKAKCIAGAGFGSKGQSSQ